jgi:hypothetical protein
VGPAVAQRYTVPPVDAVVIPPPGFRVADADNVVRPGDGQLTHHSEILFLSTFSGASDR